MDAWAAIVLLLVAATVIVRVREEVLWHDISILTFFLIFIPWLQYSFGLIELAGTAWISTAYLAGFLLALLIGARWESVNPGQLADTLFLSIGIAALLSVGLQLQQWLRLDLLGIWSMGEGFGRPFANFGQPNNLGTFLIWGLLACAWGLTRQYIGVGTALVIAAYLLFGLALTQSRTAWLSILMLVCASWWWRRFWMDNRIPWLVTAMGLYFAIAVISLSWLNQRLFLSLPSDGIDLVRMSGELRSVVWSMFIDAALQQPFLGYGWNQVGIAQLNAAIDHPSLHILFSHSHNLFLDFIIWCGLPIGFFISFYFLRWVWNSCRKIENSENSVLILVLLVIGNHAMLELPLHHAYFLLPTGLFMGALNTRLNAQPVIIFGRWSIIFIWFVSAVLLGLLIRDYARIEPSYQSLRFEWARIKTQNRGSPPDVLLLTQWQEFVRFARFEPSSSMSPSELEWMRQVTRAFPSAGHFHKLAAALAMNQHPEEARQWLKKLCKLVSEGQCQAVKNAWASQSLQNPNIAAVSWPN
jgi:hypothetical protein